MQNDSLGGSMLLPAQAGELLSASPVLVAGLANIASLLYASLEHVNWAGFYLMHEGRLILGPFCGKPACIEIPVGHGVCGTAVAQNRIVRVDDVHAFPGHIACDSASASEIVLPLRRDGQVVGVLDIDSPISSRFTERDQEILEEVVRRIDAANLYSCTGYSF